MTRATVVQNRVAPSNVTEIEPFGVYAFNEVEALRDALVEDDALRICEFPDCSVGFKPRLSGQVYCCGACKGFDTAERRTVGLKASAALLAHRKHKYDKPHTYGAELCKTARRYLSRLQSEWMESRKVRIANAIERNVDEAQ